MIQKRNWQQEMDESFGMIFLLERRLEYVFDRLLASHDLTMKQWLVLAAIDKLFGGKPSIQEVARELNTSHQNVKAIALNLEKRGFLVLETDPKDRRVTRLATTRKNKEFWQNREAEDKVLFAELFKYLTPQEVVSLHQSLIKLLEGSDELSEKLNNETQEE